jgi:hypothetical protein
MLVSLAFNHILWAKTLWLIVVLRKKQMYKFAICKQPAEEFYHHEGGYIDTNGVIIYNPVNGICIISPEPGEFMFAPLKKSLIAGQICFLKLYQCDL